MHVPVLPQFWRETGRSAGPSGACSNEVGRGSGGFKTRLHVLPVQMNGG